ncbi:putative adenylyltransferase/sulfurtransferase MoeZ [Candidatus Xiphinematobacter sp. Idaho Grape]|uniref:molybdopterin-synthase adenylyltransferase MoeB n=1 Tax=Candidatus Xiphinematobacter sp. Idaho Grape TaxID=1704307 RepID=UPI000706EF7A|nr:molybdopterin-synthase adenylyltransferase MoeB [Candidatus Xiphinematobacter sp. Idaho Grape]ALJ56696.1 putative adenylyltransferase/sulfurtransferase MoeZ [Candidatus Xiphinematobacter sp. Idaho Grape]
MDRTSSIIGTERIDSVELGRDEVARYARHLIMPEITLEGQKKLKASSVLCIGAGGLGSPIALYLAAAGIGKLGLVDFDIVDRSNLQRQVLHGTKDIGRKKLDSALERIRDINPHVSLVAYDCLFCSENAASIVMDYDLIVDGTDNFQTRYLSNDVCFFLKKPNIYGSIFRFEGQSTVFAPHLGGPCYRCLFPEPPPPGTVPSCAEGGVLGVLPGIVGLIQSIECIKLLVGIGNCLIGRLLHFDALKMKFSEFRIRKDPRCPLCSERPTLTGLIDYEQFCGVSRSAEIGTAVPTVSVEVLREKLSSGIPLTLLDVRELHEHQIARIPGSRLIPLGELASRMSELDAADEIYIHCKTGGRSMRALCQLRDAGFTKLFNVEGGIHAWSDRIDPSVPQY